MIDPLEPLGGGFIQLTIWVDLSVTSTSWIEHSRCVFTVGTFFLLLFEKKNRLTAILEKFLKIHEAFIDEWVNPWEY